MEEGLLKKNGMAILKGEIIAFGINILALIILSLIMTYSTISDSGNSNISSCTKYNSGINRKFYSNDKITKKRNCKWDNNRKLVYINIFINFANIFWKYKFF